MSTNLQRVPSPAYIVPTVLLVAALLPWPYGYYQLLRLIVCGCSAWIAIEAYGRSRILIASVAAGTALLFNPVFSIHFEREVWGVLDVACALALACMWFFDRRGKE